LAKKASSMNSLIQETIDAYQHYHNPWLTRLLKLSGFNTLEWEAQGAVVRDIDGKEYIDCLGGYGVFALGHRHPKVVDAVKDQLDKLPLSTKVMFSKPLGDLCKKLAEITPGKLQYSFISNSGTEAVEGALKLARLSTGKPQIIYAQNAFHGKTLGALSASGREQYRAPFEPLLPDFVSVPFGDAAAVESAITKHTAGVILEPVQGEGGICLPPDGYLETVRKICDNRKILLILDEVQTGFGRTGKWFACQHWNVVPDILVLAKALGGGVMPIGAFVATEAVWSAFKANPLIHTSTFGGNPLACRAALAAIQVMEEENLPQEAEKKGKLLLGKLQALLAHFPEIVQEVRGLGLMIGIELVSPHFGGALIPEMAKQGVLVAYTLNQPKVIRLEPPLVISEKQIEKVVDVFEASLKKVKSLFTSSQNESKIKEGGVLRATR
jgi:putrescine aminotransferase